MLTLILPGYSPHNKDWAKEVKTKLKISGEVEVFYWDHWKTEKSLSIKNEVARILQLIGDRQVNFIAKSVGTKVLMSVLPNIKEQVNKVILCGIPIDPVGYVRGIKLLKPKNLLVIQNSADPFMPAKPIKVYLQLVDKQIKVIEKDAHNHDYPYFEDFRDFLSIS